MKDSSERVTLEWLKQVGVATTGGSAESGLYSIISFSGAAVSVWFVVDRNIWLIPNAGVIPYQHTRGDVRQLCRCLKLKINE